MAKARNVRSGFNFGPMTPLDAQEFLDFFGRGESGVDRTRSFNATEAPEALKEFAPQFQAQKTDRPIFAPQHLDLDNPHQGSTPKQIGTVKGVTESRHEIAQRNAPGTGASNTKDNPLWSQAYDAALIKFREESKKRTDLSATRKAQKEGRKERKDVAVTSGLGRPSGTELITSSQGFLGGVGGGSSLLK